jgi:SnoaL-like domain
MPGTIAKLMLRNLEAFGDIDPVRRRKAFDEVWHPEGTFYDPHSGPIRGRDAIDAIAGKVKATHPSYRYQPLAPPDEIGDAGRVRWVSGEPGKKPEYAGTDVVIVRDGQIYALYMFFDELP